MNTKNLQKNKLIGEENKMNDQEENISKDKKKDNEKYPQNEDFINDDYLMENEEQKRTLANVTNEDYINIIKEKENIESDCAAKIFYHMLEKGELLEKYVGLYSQNYRNNNSEIGLSQLEKIAEKEEGKHKELKKLFVSKTDSLSEYSLLEKALIVFSGVISKKIKEEYEEKLEIKYDIRLRQKRLQYLEGLKEKVTDQERILKEMSIDYRNKMKENFVNLKKSIKDYKLYSDSIKKIHLKNEEEKEKGVISELDEDLRNWESKREELATDIKLYNTKNQYLNSRLSRIKMKRDHFSSVKNKLYYNINWIMYRIEEEEKKISLKDLVKNIKELEEIVNLNSLFDKTESEFIKEYEKMPNKDFLTDYSSAVETKNLYDNYEDSKSRTIRDAERIIVDFENMNGSV